MTFGAPLAPVVFPATDRPSSGFVTRFERALRTTNLAGAPFSLALTGVVEAPFGDCLASMGPTAQHIVVSIGGAHGLISVPDAVLPMLIEFAYGGDGSEAAEDIAGSSLLGTRFGYRIGSMLAEAIAPVLHGIDITVLGATEVPVEAVSMKAFALACGFAVMAGETSLGAIGLCVAVRTLADLENAATGTIADQNWATSLGEALGSARVNVRCVLARPTLSAGEVAQLVPGSVIPIPNLNEVALIAGGYRIATGVADARDGRAAITINRTEFLS
jgi:flagellar motor switch protein FliM